MDNSRNEQALRACIDGTGSASLSAPKSRIEMLLHNLADKLAGMEYECLTDAEIDAIMSEEG